MPLRALLPAIAVTLVCCWTRLAAAENAAAALIEPPAATSFELSSASDPDKVVVPLKRREGVEALVSVSVVKVAIGDQLRPALNGSFTPTIAGDQLTIAVAFTKIWQAATYSVTVELIGTVKDAPAKGRQELVLQLVLPPARLRPIPSIVVHDDRWWGFTADVDRTIVLVEQSRLTRVVHLSVEQIDPAVQVGHQVDGHFEAKVEGKQIPGTLEAGGRMEVTLSGHGFPSGTTTGQITVSGDPLAQPIMVPFEVHARLVDYYILPLFWLAGLLGWFVRHRLKDLEARRAADAQLAPLLVEAAREIDTNPILEHQQAIATGRATVWRAVDDGVLAAMQTAADGLRRALDAARAARATWINQRLVIIAGVHEAVNRRWDLPAALPAALPALVDRCEQALLADRPRAVAADLDQIVASIDPLGAAGNTWKTTATRTLTGFADAAALAPASLRAETRRLLDDATRLVAAVPSYDVNPRPEVGAYLAVLHAARRSTRVLVDTVKSGLADEAWQSVKALTDAKGGSDLIDRVTRVANGAYSDDPADAIAALGTALVELNAAVSTHVKSNEARALVAAGKYAAAVTFEKALNEQQDATSKIASFTAELHQAAARRTEARLTTAADAPPAVRMVAGAPPVDPVVLARARLRDVARIRAVASAVILSLAAWATLRGSWIGTIDDFVKVMAIAFFTDFTLDAVVEAITKLRPALPPTT